MINMSSSSPGRVCGRDETTVMMTIKHKLCCDESHAYSIFILPAMVLRVIGNERPDRGSCKEFD